ncbi:hypothetical protein PHLCEN_2v3257 [Hermanssonia centrifuga]|uniref:Uncharacterized protein n=1 Tax=Hermanssonia centrifuga TaxID=98765 RepID=A0A2R6QUK7_9APHY|nr:hypothetical protein PHLCEN_2v3257 [Hermanssonia centrifuga]
MSLVALKENEVQERSEVAAEEWSFNPSDDLLFWQAPDGEIFTDLLETVDSKTGTSSPIAKFPRFYPYAEHASGVTRKRKAFAITTFHRTYAK